MRKNFRSYLLAVEFYRAAKTLPLPTHLKDQLNRAASSIVLNLAEGSGRRTKPDQRKFFHIAFGSLRECQAILDLSFGVSDQLTESADVLAAHIYRLIQAVDKAT